MQEPKFDEGKVHEKDWGNHMASGMKGMRAEVKDRMKDFPTREFRVHAKAAQREMLLAFRSLLDKAIEKLEDKPESEEPKSGRIVIE